MAVLIHVLIAISSLAYSTYLVFDPSETKFKPSYFLLGGTIASGSYLVIFSGANIIKTCLLGLFFTGFTLTAIIIAKQRLAAQGLRSE